MLVVLKVLLDSVNLSASCADISGFGFSDLLISDRITILSLSPDFLEDVFSNVDLFRLADFLDSVPIDVLTEPLAGLSESLDFSSGWTSPVFISDYSSFLLVSSGFEGVDG